ncbi:MAG: cation-translocating P-type ATPase [Bacillota bacterium]
MTYPTCTGASCGCTAAAPERTGHKGIDFGTVLIFISGAGLLLGLALPLFSMPHLALYSFAASVASGLLPVIPKAFASLRNRTLDMNVLLLVSTSGAMYLGRAGEAAALVFLFVLGGYLESRATDRTRRSLWELISFVPETAEVKRGDSVVSAAVEGISPGEVVVVKPGMRIPVDGIVSFGESTVNQSAITGESVPVRMFPGCQVYAGTINNEGYLEVQVTKEYKDTTLQRIIQLVKKAEQHKAPVESFVNRFARIYTPSVIVLALVLTVAPPVIFALEFEPWLYRGLALLVVSCPCALVISTPVAFVSAIGSSARSGVLVKGGAFLEEIARARAVAFDKTGTLTSGRLRVTEIHPAPGYTEEEVLRVAASVERKSEHPLARAICLHAEELGVRGLELLGFRSVPGRGALGLMDGVTWWVGNAAMAEACNTQKGVPQLFADDGAPGGTKVIVGTDRDGVIGYLTLGDEIRPGASELIRRLKARGIKTVLLTGDNQAAAVRIGNELGVDEVRWELLPEQKLQAVSELKRRFGSTVMVGDGVNDAPALALADVGVAMGRTGSDTALDTADVVLMRDDLVSIDYLWNLARRTSAVVRQNIALAVAIKLLATLLAFPGFLSLVLAVLADDGAAVLVTLNALRLTRVQRVVRE